MKNKLISYSLFSPSKIFNHRDEWDLYNNLDRYWYNIPALVCINSIFYKGFKMKFHLSKGILDHKLYVLFENLVKYFNVEVEVIDSVNLTTEATVWRFKPLFNSECDILLTRDIDSLPTVDEILSVYYFLNKNKYAISSIRSHTAHAGEQTIMMAGLSSFKLNKINVKYNFEDVLKKVKGSEWGIDQDLLIETFANNNEWNENHFLDIRLSNKDHLVPLPKILCDSFDEKYIRKRVWYKKFAFSKKLMANLDSLVNWSGEPVDIRGEKLMKILSCNFEETSKMLEILKKHEVLNQFYL